MSVFVYADNCNLSGEILALAKQSGKETAVISLDANEAQELFKYGADKVYALKGNEPWSENYAKAIAELLEKENAEAFLVGATVRGRDIAAKVAAYAKCGLVSDATAVQFKDKINTERMMYGGATVLSEDIEGFAVVTVPAGKYQASRDESKTGKFITIEAQTDTKVKLLETNPIQKEGVDLSKADKVICVGLGLDKKEDLKIVEELADAMGAAVGCTRPIADDKCWMPTETYIGISGAIVQPELYVGLGVSGQIQHIVGIRDSKIIVAVDVNEKAPIFQAADYGIVGDMYEILPLLKDALS